ncbi:Protein MON2 homolog OS=Xenopus laevis GN=mon2 PE=2 SV=1 [Rhizoctonia solani AG-1 IB]|uniref:Protein MON2 homolog n=1 Tax=Thanatephorus cucumeris (strain AG1-IB / isolate 7/3/14) TaxID=1108050 RepID=A0A0B7FBJ4_THACB|nr:Protein MON2 homolog OS=Xenopus laevis GN=mon2 PE=2 SV=1 [Rhizoctonia solani AG-1 IB]
MFVFDKVVIEQKQRSSADSQESHMPMKLTQFPDGSSANLAPSAHDAFAIFQDLCLLANSERPLYLQLEVLPKTFSLELIESVLTNYYELFKSRPELLMLLRHHLCPLLLKSLSDRPHFPLTLRSTRVVFLLLKQFSIELETESEVFLMLFIKVITGDSDNGEAPRPHWMRVLAMEIVRGLCSDEDLMRGIWERYDSRDSGSSGVFTALITALRRLATEKPGLLGVSSQMGGIGVSTRDAAAEIAGSSSVYGGNVGLVAGMVANAATNTISGVVGMMAGGPGLNIPGSSMKLQCIDQLDKADSPIIPETYIYLLSLQCFVSLADSLTAFALQQYTTIMLQRPRAAGEAIIRAPPALDLSSLPESDPNVRQIKIAHSMLENGWPGLLAALSFFITTNLSEELFADALVSMQNLTNATGALGLSVPRDAFMTSLSRFAVPSKVVSSLESYVESSAPRTPGMVDSMGLAALSGGPTSPPGLSDRNLACLKTFTSITLFLAGSLGPSWFDVIELLQNADYVLTAKGARSMNTGGKRSSMLGNSSLAAKLRSTGIPPPTPGASSISSTPRHPLFADLDPEAILVTIEKIFDASKSLEDSAFGDFVHALCKLSAAMVGMQSDNVQIETTDDPKSSSTMLQTAPSSDNLQRRRASGIHVTRTLRTGDYGIAKLGAVALLNVHRLVYRDPEVAWNTIIKHLLSVIGKGAAPPSIRMQAAEVLDEILTIVPRNLSTAGDLQPQVQNRVLDALSAQVTLEGHSSTVIDVRKLGLETLHTILQFSGHTLVTGWGTIFAMLGNVCKPNTQNVAPVDDVISIKSPTSSVPSTPRPFKPLQLQPKNSNVLVRIAFQSMTLMCDNLDGLSPEHLRLCITTLGFFGRQSDTNIALTAAESLLWSVSDSVQAKRSDPEKEEEYSQLWMFLLLELLGLCSDSRPEVRNGSIQTLFRTLQFYGATLSAETWNECMWKIVFPLMSTLTTAVEQALVMLSPEAVPESSHSAPASKAWYETKTLAFQSIASILNDFLTTKIMYLDDYDRGWARFLEIVTDSVLADDRTTSTAALRCLERGLISMKKTEGETTKIAIVSKEQIWVACDKIGSALELHTPPSGLVFTQECLQAFVDVIKGLHSASCSYWDLDRFRRCLMILKSVITYPNSPDYRPDIDGLTPVQSVVLDAVLDFDLNLPGLPSLVLTDLSEFATLAFLASFDVPDINTGSDARKPPRRVTYIGMAKRVMPTVVEIYTRFKTSVDIYEDGTLDRMLSAYSIPIKLKYDCPAPSKFGNDLPLWKTATTCALQVIKDSTLELPKLGAAVSDGRVEAIWRQIIDVFRGGLLADCSAAEALPLDVQDAEENFDLTLLSSLEVDIIPHLGGARVPDYVITQFARILHAASTLHTIGGSGTKSNVGGESWEDEDPTTESMRSVPRERFAYWAFDLLALVCAAVETGKYIVT